MRCAFTSFVACDEYKLGFSLFCLSAIRCINFLQGPHWVHLSLKNYFLAPDEVCLTATFLHLFYKVQSKDVAMLLKVKYQNTKKYIRLLSVFTFLDFIAQVKYKFGLPDATELDAFDETNTVVEEDIFSELIEASPDLCLTVRDRIPDAAQTLEQDIVLEIQIDPPSPTTQDGISEEDFSPLDHSTSTSLTDTNTSLSSDSDHSSQIEYGTPIGRRTSSSEVIPRPTTEVSESEAAKEMVKNALLCKPGGEDVIEEYKAEKSLTHRTRRQLVNILASHMTESHGSTSMMRRKALDI